MQISSITLYIYFYIDGNFIETLILSIHTHIITIDIGN